MQAVWQDDVVTDMPARLIDDQNDPFGRPGSKRGSKFGQYGAPDIRRDRGQQQPKRVPALRADKAIQIRPAAGTAIRDSYVLTRGIILSSCPGNVASGRVGIIRGLVKYRAWQRIQN